MINQYLETIQQIIDNGKYKDNWQSLGEYPVPQWYKNAKFGLFIHWGVYSVPAYFSEWYPRMMYYKGNPIYWHHVKKYGKQFNYREFIPMFKAENFDAEKWVTLFKRSGAKYIMPVGEHHDGFKMYNSDLSKWTSVNMGPCRDILGEIKAECEKQGGIEFATSSHRAEHFWFLNGGRTVGYNNEVMDDNYRDFYGEGKNVNKCNNLFTLLKQENGIIPTDEWLKDWLVHSCDLIDRYQPSTLFFDWWVNIPEFRPYMKKFLAYYFNRSLEWGKEVCVQYKSDACMYNASIYDCERGQLGAISPYLWQSETSTAYNSWSYCTTNRFKKPSDIACNFLDVISKNGNFVLNVGPMADGTFCEQELNILNKMGEWTSKNSEAIWGTSPYKMCGEGHTKTKGSFNERNLYNKKDFRFTYKMGKLFIFALKPTKSGVYKIMCLRKGRDTFNHTIVSSKLLGYNNKITVENTKKFLKISVDGNVNTDMPICFELTLD